LASTHANRRWDRENYCALSRNIGLSQKGIYIAMGILKQEYPKISGQPELSLVVPCYNEADVIRNTATRLIKVFREREVNFELVLVDNGSKDGTGEIIDQMVEEGLPVVKVRIQVNEGYGNGVLEGLRVCQGKLVGFVCADGQVEAHDVGKVYDIAAHARSPLLVKVRRRFRMDGIARKIVSIIYNVMTVLLFGNLSSIDLNGNPKILPREYLERMNLQSKDWFLDAEVMIKAKKLSLNVFEMNVIAQMREGGKSNVRGSTIREFLLNLYRYRFNINGVMDMETQRQPEQKPLIG
jgi:glycosyltransferase involved in cell wall biosynthesis